MSPDCRSIKGASFPQAKEALPPHLTLVPVTSPTVAGSRPVALARLAQIIELIERAMRQGDKEATFAVWSAFGLSIVRQRHFDRSEGVDVD